MEDYSQYLKLINNCDPEDPLISSTRLGERLAQIPLLSVDPVELSNLQALNLRQLVPTENGLARDYRGLAELMGFSPVEVETRFKRSYNPIRSLIDASVNRDLNIKSNLETPSVNTLLKMLEKIERFDVIDDLLPSLVKLAQNCSSIEIMKADRLRLERRLLEDPTSGNFDKLTIGDTNQNSAILYDAFICFAPDDFKYAEELICFLEERNKRVAIAEDLLPGRFEHDALMRLIESRCRKVIVLLTPNFLSSRECEFRSKFASELAIRSGSHNIIPVICEHCEDSLLPSMIKVLSKIDMTNINYRRWSLNKLICALEVDSRNQLEPRLYSAYNGNSDNKSNVGRALKHPEFDSAKNYPLKPLEDQHSDISREVEPVVELMLSQSSSFTTDLIGSSDSSQSRINLSPTLPPSSSLTSTSPRTSSWFRNVKECTKRLVNGISLTSENNSSNSQAKLLLNSTDLSDEITQTTSLQD